MNYKILYILVSDDKDLYYEELLISILSLKKHMPESFVVLLTDNITAASLHGLYRGLIHNYISELNVVEFSDKYNKLIRSRLLKTNMRNYVNGDFLYIDCDTVITESFNEGNFDCNIGAVLDLHVGSTVGQKDAFELLKRQGIVLSGKFYNSGVLWCKDVPSVRNFFKEWNYIYKRLCSYFIYTDQPAFCIANNKMGNVVTEMNGKWNCQISYGGIAYLNHAKIIHSLRCTDFDNDDSFILANEKVKMKMKKNGEITEEVYTILEDPKTYFNNCYLISYCSVDGYIYISNCYAALRKIYIDYNAVFKIVDRCIRFIRTYRTRKRYKKKYSK